MPMILHASAPKKICLVGVIMIALFIVERATKWIAQAHIPREGALLLDQALGFYLERNQGIAFSLPLPRALLLFLTACILLALGILWHRAAVRKELPVVWAVSFLFIGTVSNAIDRVRLGYVVDFIRLTSWPTFNLADVFICSGVSTLLVYYFINRNEYARPTHDRVDHRH